MWFALAKLCACSKYHRGDRWGYLYKSSCFSGQGLLNLKTIVAYCCTLIVPGFLRLTLSIIHTVGGSAPAMNRSVLSIHLHTPAVITLKMLYHGNACAVSVLYVPLSFHIRTISLPTSCPANLCPRVVEKCKQTHSHRTDKAAPHQRTTRHLLTELTAQRKLCPHRHIMRLAIQRKMW